MFVYFLAISYRFLLNPSWVERTTLKVYYISQKGNI